MTKTHRQTNSTSPHRQPRLGTATILTLLGLAIYDAVAHPPLERELLTALVVTGLTLLGYGLDRLLGPWLNR